MLVSNLQRFYCRILIVSLLIIGSVNCGYSQTIIYRSIASGNWSSLATWERSTDGGGTWNPATGTQLPTSNTNVIILSPHTVILDGGKNCLNLTINSGATLNAGVSTNQLTVGNGTSGTSGQVGVAQIDGTLGGVGDNMVFQLPITASQVTFTGSGTVSIGRIRSAPNNSNYPTSATAGHADDARIIVNTNMTLNSAANYVIAALASSQSPTDSIIFTVNAGKTITLSSPTAYLHNNTVSSGLVGTSAGRYAYNINGTLDLTANTSTTSGTALIPFGNAGSSVTLNVSGLLKLGAFFKADTVVNSIAGANIALNILNGGLIDASLTTNLVVGKLGTAVGNIFFVESGTGALKRTVPGDGSLVSFPVGSNINSFSNVTLSNTGTSDVFTVNVQNSISNAAPDPNKIVNKQWNITKGTIANPELVTVKLTWLASDQAAGFNPGQTVSILHWTGSAYEARVATVTGNGTLASPYEATAIGFTSFSPFIIANFTAVPITFSNATAYTKNTGVQVDWKISNDNSTARYEVERSLNGTRFISVGAVPVVSGGVYGYFDANPDASVNYYRIKATGFDGSIRYSTIMKVNIAAGKPSITIAPNPVSGREINLQLSNIEKGTYIISLTNSAGQKVFTTKIAANGGSGSQSIELPDAVKKGSYNLQMTNGTIKLNKSIIID